MTFDPDRYGDVVFIPTFPETKPEFIETKYEAGSGNYLATHKKVVRLSVDGSTDNNRVTMDSTLFGQSKQAMITSEPSSPSIDKEAQQPNFEEEVFDYSTETENKRLSQHSGPRSSKLQTPAARRLRTGAWSK